MLKGDLKKQAILETAENLFFDKGYTDTTIDDILNVLGCSKGSLYHHFESKQVILEELCKKHSREAFEDWQQEHYETPLAALNGLLYYAMPFRAGTEKLLSLLLPLEGLSEGMSMRCALLQALELYFLPEIANQLTLLRLSETAYWHQSKQPELVWDTFTGLYGRLMQCASRLRSGGAAGDVVEYLEASRFLWERTLDLPFGSIEIVRADEALTAIHQAIKHVNHMPRIS